uniref:Selenoprotein h n=1 Tax=Tetraselmis sp. GSL018 TaxID=582737 RepID=A0A061R8T1_9CHLO
MPAKKRRNVGSSTNAPKARRTLTKTDLEPADSKQLAKEDVRRSPAQAKTPAEVGSSVRNLVIEACKS